MIANVIISLLLKPKETNFMSNTDMWQAAADAFLAGRKNGKFPKRVFNSYRILDLMNDDGTTRGEKLVYQSSDQKEDLIAIRSGNGAFVNSSVLPLVGRRSAWGSIQPNRAETPIQRYLRSKQLPVIAMNQLRDNGFDIFSISVIDQGKEETVTVKVPDGWDYDKNEPRMKPDEVRHFTGAALFQALNPKDNKIGQFLFDIDRKEIEHKRFNAFFVQLTKPVKTIAEAYRSLKPKQVIDAEKRKLDVKRQGEWYFIPTKFNPEKAVGEFTFTDKLIMNMSTWIADGTFSKEEWKELKKRKETLQNRRIGESQLRAGKNRPNRVENGTTINEVTYVKGRISHSGREHEDLVLEEWHIAIPNTSVQSWQLDGNID
jgi:hypothetical protein